MTTGRWRRRPAAPASRTARSAPRSRCSRNRYLPKRNTGRPQAKQSGSPIAPMRSRIATGWAPASVREFLVHGARRFQDLHEVLNGIAPTTLSERLRTLEKHGVLERHFYSMSPPRAEYVLTTKG